MTHLADRQTDTDYRDRLYGSLDIDRRNRDARLQRDLAAPTAVTGAAPNRSIYDAGHTQDLPGTEKRTEGQAASGDSEVDTSYDWLGVTFDFYLKNFQRNSIDGAGLGLVSSVHYGRDYDNAFWDGKQMVYGDGDGHLFVEFTKSLDVTGHELTHGVTQYTANLDYQGQSGALNESVSDVFGVQIKQYHLDQTADQADWLIGADVLGPDVQGVALRSMKAPGTAYDDDQLGKDPQPGTMADYVNTTDDNGGVHINSGIPNRAFYLAATGIGGYSWEKAGKIWYAALTGGSLASSADFAAFAGATIDTARDLYGDSSDEVNAVRGAWDGVGVSV
jgi:Zn-dependent metalloprotease